MANFLPKSVSEGLLLKAAPVQLQLLPAETSTTRSKAFEIITKGQLISKANCQVEDSSKKRTNEFVFTSMRRVFVRFLEESSAKKKHFEII